MREAIETAGQETTAPGGTGSHRTTIIAVVLLTLASAAAIRFVAVVHPTTLVPWVAAFALAVAWTFRRPRAVDLFEPVTFLSWIHYAPAFVVGSGLLAVGIVAYPYPTIVADPVASCALTLCYVGIGYLALTLGSRWRGAHWLGTRIGRILPAPPEDRTIPLSAILVLVALGMAANYGAFRAGIIGFAVPRPPGALDAAVSYAGLFVALGHFLYWFRWFAPDQKRPSRITLLLPLLIVVATMVILGNRGALLSSYLVAAFAFRLARGRLTVAQGVVVVVLAFAALGIGMVYGSLFRYLRGGESGTAAAAAVDAAVARRDNAPATTVPPPATPVVTPVATAPVAPLPALAATPVTTPAPVQPKIRPTPSVAPASATPAPSPTLAPPSLERHLEVAAATATNLIRNPGSAPLFRILEGVGDRLNLVSDASVTIARFPALKHLEPEYGISSIWTMTWTGFVPRVLWPGKPKVSDARAYASLYFGHNYNSYATTPVVDLVRNFGPLGMPLGMALFGAVLGVLSAALLAPGTATVSERAALFSLIVVNISLEGSFGLLLPTMFRVALVVMVGLALVRLFTVRPGRRPAR